MEIALIAAMDLRNAIGIGNKLPWNLPADLKHFRAKTEGHPIIMGRKTFESIKKALPGRTNIVISRQRHLRLADAMVVATLEDAVEKAKIAASETRKNRIYIIGGGEIFKEALPLANVMELTIVDATIEGATAFFPEFNRSMWRSEAQEYRQKDEQNAYNCSFLTLRKK